MDIICKRHLEKVRDVLRSGRARADAATRGKIDLLLRIADTALDTK